MQWVEFKDPANGFFVAPSKPEKPWEKCPHCGRWIGIRHCQYCGKAYRTKPGLERHEKKCYLNPNRECPVCHGEGTMQVEIGVEPWGATIYDTNPCYACEEAKKRLAERRAFDELVRQSVEVGG